MDEKQRSKIKVTAALGLLVLSIVVTFYAYNIERNLRTRKTLARTCGLIEAALSEDFSENSLSPVYEEDTAFVRERMAASLHTMCTTTDHALAFWHWNGSGSMDIERDAASETRLARIFDEVHTKCPGILATAMAGMPGDQDHERGLEYGRNFCEPLERRVRAIASIPDTGYSAWDWAARLNAIAHDIDAHPERPSAPSPY